MRVNVTYSIELDEVKQLVKELLLKAESDLDDLHTSFSDILNAANQEEKNKEIISKIQKCRSSAASLDHILYDCGHILAGYQQTAEQLREDPVGPPLGQSNESPERQDESG